MLEFSAVCNLFSFACVATCGRRCVARRASEPLGVADESPRHVLGGGSTGGQRHARICLAHWCPGWSSEGKSYYATGDRFVYSNITKLKCSINVFHRTGNVCVVVCLPSGVGRDLCFPCAVARVPATAAKTICHLPTRSWSQSLWCQGRTEMVVCCVLLSALWKCFLLRCQQLSECVCLCSMQACLDPVGRQRI